MGGWRGDKWGRVGVPCRLPAGGGPMNKNAVAGSTQAVARARAVAVVRCREKSCGKFARHLRPKGRPFCAFVCKGRAPLGRRGDTPAAHSPPGAFRRPRAHVVDAPERMPAPAWGVP